MTTRNPEWFGGIMTVNTSPGLVEWLCPVTGCLGTMIYNGTCWPVTDPGYHHVCNACGIALVIPLAQYPKTSSEPGKSVPPGSPGLAEVSPWERVLIDPIKIYLRKLTDAQRLRFIGEACGEFCHHCGRIEEDGRHCRCWDDE